MREVAGTRAGNSAKRVVFLKEKDILTLGAKWTVTPGFVLNTLHTIIRTMKVHMSGLEASISRTIIHTSDITDNIYLA
jgi:hypothetical protein